MMDTSDRKHHRIRRRTAWLSQFESTPELICVVDAEFKIVYCNPTWDAVAIANAAESATGDQLSGLSLIQFIPSALEYYYVKLLQRAREKREVVYAEYECNTPEMYRRFCMALTPIPRSPLLAIVHTLKDAGTIPYAPHLPGDHNYGQGELVLMCAQCRRTKRLRENRWDWVPEFVRSMPPHVGHGICEACAASYTP
jgi:hypothetical protein